MNTFSFKFKTLLLTLVGVFFLSIADANAQMSAVCARGRIYLRYGSPLSIGKVCVLCSQTSPSRPGDPAASKYRLCHSANYYKNPVIYIDSDKGKSTEFFFHFYAKPEAGCMFLGWFDADDNFITDDLYCTGSIVTASYGIDDGGQYAYVDRYAAFMKIVQMNFVRPENGSFTIEHNGNTVSNYASFTTNGRVILTALPDEGYKLRGWYTTTDGGATKNYFSFGQQCEPNFTEDVTIGADFVPDDGRAIFWVKGEGALYDDLNDANAAAVLSASKVIGVANDGVLPAGNYTISSGVTLVVPFREVYESLPRPRPTERHVTSNAAMATTTYRKLSLAEGANITCYGDICVDGRLGSAPGSGNRASSYPSGNVGILDMSHGGLITLESGAKLYAWGYIKGQDMDQGNNTIGCGAINAKSGSEVWEFFQVGDWRGGNNCLTIYNNRDTWKYFPFQAWSIQNIEVPVTYNYGAQCKCKWSVYGNAKINTIDFTAIANSGAGSLFQIASGGTVRKWYDPTTDHVCVELGGSSTLSAITLKVMGFSMSTTDFYLPIPANVRIILKSGANTTISNSMVVHPGAVIDVKPGANLTISNSNNCKVFLFDKDNWGKYCMNRYYCTYNSPSIHYNRGDGTTNTLLEDATVIVDGTATVAGGLYASTGGANIMGNDAGHFTYNKTINAATTVVQCTGTSTAENVPVNGANLHNENGTYTKASAGSAFTNVHGRWYFGTDSEPDDYNHTYGFTYIKSGAVIGTSGTDVFPAVSACYSKDQTGVGIRDKWANVEEGCDEWWTGLEDDHLYHYDETEEQWHQYVKTTTTVAGSAIYSGTNGKLVAKDGCDLWDFTDINPNCQYELEGVEKAVVGNTFVQVAKNTSPDEGYHKSDAASTYYLCFPGCVWQPATREDVNLYTVSGTKYIWYNDAWLAVEYDSEVGLHYSYNESNVKEYYEYVSPSWVLAAPTAEVITSTTMERVYSLGTAQKKANDCNSNVTVRLLRPIKNATFNYTGEFNCSLDLNGFTFSHTANGFVKMSGTGRLIIKDQSGTGEGEIALKHSADARRYAVVVTAGNCTLNGGIIRATGTSSSVGIGAVDVQSGASFTMIGGEVTATSKVDTWGIHTGSSSTVDISGGTLTSSTTSTSAAPVAIYSEGGTTTVSGGTVSASTTTSTAAIGVQLVNSGAGLAMTGGTVSASAKNGAEAVRSAGTANISGGTLSATTTVSGAYGVTVQGGTTTVSGAAAINASAPKEAYGLYTNGGTLNGNGGTITVATTSTTDAHGVYAQAGTTVINNGEFLVTSKTTGAYGIFVPSTTPSCTVKGGKFKVKTNNGAEPNTAVVTNNAASSNLLLTGGYYNIAPTAYMGGKAAVALNNTITEEAALIAAGYNWKIAAGSWTVTWKNYDGSTIGTTMVEGGSHPVWTGAEPTYTVPGQTFVFDGWCTAKQNGGSMVNLDVVTVAGNVTYFAHYKMLIAEVEANGETTPYYSVTTAWNAAMAEQQATLRLLADVSDMPQLLFNSTTVSNEKTIITLDLNGFHWTMDGTTAGNQKSPFILVNKAGCKLIVTDNSDKPENEKGYLHITWAKTTDGALCCVQVAAGELVLQKGGIRANNTEASKYSEAVHVDANGTFTMTGGEVYATDAKSPRGVVAYGKADIVGGTVHAAVTDADQASSYGLLPYGTMTVGGDAIIKASAARENCFVAQVEGTLTVEGGTFIGAAAKNARVFYANKAGGKIIVNGNPTVIDTVRTGSGAYAVQASAGEIEINGGTYTVKGNAANVFGLYATTSETTSGKITMNGGTFNLNGGTSWTFGAYANGGDIDLKGGTFTVDQASGANVEAVRVYPNSTCNISGGTYKVVKTTGPEKDQAIGQAMRILGGTTIITGEPEFTANEGLNVADYPVADGNLTASVTIDGGIFNTTSWCVRSKTVTVDTKSITGDVTIKDGKFKSSNGSVIETSSPVSCLKVTGGWYSNNASGKLSVYNASTNPTGYVRDPSTVETGTVEYPYHVISKFTVTWRVNGSDDQQYYNYNEIPVYGSVPTMSGPDTYEFIGWSDGVNFYDAVEILPAVTASVTYEAVFRKIEAEVYRGENPTPERYEFFADAWNDAKELPVAKVRLLSDVSRSEQIDLNPSEETGSKPLTLDLNDHKLSYTGDKDRFIIVRKSGIKLIVTDESNGTRGEINCTLNYNDHIYGVVIYGTAELQLAGGKIFTKNTYAAKSAAGVTPCATSTFIMTGGTVETHAATGARAVGANDSPTIRVSGGKLIAKSFTMNNTDTVWGVASYGIILKGTLEMTGNPTVTSDASSNAYGVCLSNAEATFDIQGGNVIATTRGNYPCAIRMEYASLNNKISGGTFEAINKGMTGEQIHAVHAVGGSKVEISGGTFTAYANNTLQYAKAHCVFVQNATVDISGGTFTAKSDYVGSNGVGADIAEVVRVYPGATCLISGGEFSTETNGSVVHCLGGTTTINGGKFTANTGFTVAVAEAGKINLPVGDVRLTINGGTFISSKQRNIYAGSNEETTSVAVRVNGGYFYGGKKEYIVQVANNTNATITLYGGKYNEYGTTTSHRSNITDAKYLGANTELSPIDETVDGRKYVYQLSTKYNITWVGGDSYSKDENVSSGTMPENHELDGKYFLRNDSAFYFTGWDPTPALVTDDATYNAIGDYWEAKVTVGVKDSLFAEFDDAWAYALSNQAAKITLLNNITRTARLRYQPTEANSTHTLDLNNFTIAENTSDRLLIVSKTDAKLTITDSSEEKGGRLYKKMDMDVNIYGSTIYTGELILAGGTIYVENTRALSADAWYPAIGIHTGQTPDAKFTMTGGKVEVQAVHQAFPLYNFGTMLVSDGTVIANVSGSRAYGINVVDGVATVEGGTFNVSASNLSYGALANGWTKPDGTQTKNSLLNINGGTFNVSGTTSHIYGLQIQGTGRVVGSTIVTAYAVANVTGGTFNVTCSAASTTQVFAVQCAGWREFDTATPHNLLAESYGRVNISGGTFTVDTRNNGAWVENKDNVDLIRNWGEINVSGGTFTVYQNQSAAAVSSYRNKITVSGNPVFNVNCKNSARGAMAGAWNHSDYCDGNADNNHADIDINGGTFNINASEGTALGVYVNGTISEADVKGYAMSSKITVNGGEFLCTAKQITLITQQKHKSGTYGTAKREVFIKGGKFKTTIVGSSNEPINFEPGSAGVKLASLAGGYFSHNVNNNWGLQLEHLADDTCYVTNITSADIDPEFNNGYNYRIDVMHPEGEVLDVVDWTGNTLTINVSDWPANGWPYTVNGISYPQTSDGTLTIPHSGVVECKTPIIVTNKDGETVSRHTYTVPYTNPTTIKSNLTMDVYLHNTTWTVNGNFTMHNVYVGVDAKIVINSGKTLTANSLFLRTDVDRSAELVKNGNIAGTTKIYYTRIVKDNSAYYQFGLPWSTTSGVKVKDIRLANGKDPHYGGTWILRRYNENTRAQNGKGNNWNTLDENESVTGGVGYEMSSTLKYYREFLFPVTVPSPLPTSVPVTHHDGAAGATESGWNILVSPLTSTYTQTPVPEGPVFSWMTPHGFEQDMPSSIPPAKVFAYQAAESGSLIFGQQLSVVAAAPRRIKAIDEETRIQWIQLDIEDASGEGDQTSVYSHPERYNDTYQTGIDVAKQMLTGPHALLYSLRTYGAMAFAGIADEVLEQGVPLTVYSPAAQELTISMRDNDWLDRLEEVYLLDNKTGARIDLLMQDYTFDAEAGTTEGRFILFGVFKAPLGPTDIQNGEASDGKQVRKLLINDKLYIIRNGMMYDATGKQVKK